MTSSGPGRRRRPRYGRRRGAVPVGHTLIARLGPRGDELFAALDDVDEEPVRLKPGPDTPLEEVRFVAIDCETTGRTPHHIIELGAVAFTLERHLMSFESLVHTSDRINPYALRLHGISSQTLGGAPPVEAVLERFRRLAQGALLVEHSADAFDTRLVARTMREAFEADNVDTSRLAAKLWGLKETIGLERLCQELGVQNRRPHHALADAEATAACFLALLREGRSRFGWDTVGALLADGQPPPPRFPSRRQVARSSAGRRQRAPAGARGDPATDEGLVANH
ncbi:MAG TPA: 3'-5' exonuclease [Candidatus Sulfotelmatobacter sp.]|nr:3'-5' exonuclease [Candidatus Sulfotelmatobacter sp.]